MSTRSGSEACPVTGEAHLTRSQPAGLAQAASLHVRYDFLDWLRVLAIFVLLFFHTGMLFVGWGWHIENPQTIDALEWPMAVAHRLRMPLLFVIAGASMWFALRGRSGAQLVRDRTLRLFVPLLAGVFLIVPPQIYLERMWRHQWDGSYLSFLLERTLQIQPYPQGDFSWHHLWFIVYLYAYTLVVLPLLLWWRHRASALRPGAWLYALALPLALNEALLKPLFPEAHNLVADWYVFNHYLLLTLYGYLLASMPASWDWLAAERRRALGIGLVTFGVAVFSLETGIIHRNTVADALVSNVFTWLWLMVFIGYARRYLSFSNGLLRWARQASYPFYILHQTIIIMIGYALLKQPWHPWLKYAVVLSGTLLSCGVLYELCIRRWALMRFIFGVKVQRRTRPAVEVPAALV